MALFNKKTSLIRTICFMSFFAAINVVCSALTVFIPLISVILIIFLPLTSAIVEINCKDRWFPIYAFATIGLSVVVSLQSFDFTLFYIIPSIATGYIFGLMSKKKLPGMFSVLIASLIQTILSFAFIPLMELITERNLIDDIIRIFSVNNLESFNNSLILIFFVVGLMQTALSYFVVQDELKKFGVEQVKEKDYKLYAFFGTIAMALLSVISTFFYMPISYLFVGICFFFGAFSVFNAIDEKRNVVLIVDACGLLIGLFVFAIFNQMIPEAASFLLLMVTPSIAAIASISDYFLKKSK